MKNYPTLEFLNAIPGRPCLMLPWRVTETSELDSHYLVCAGDDIDLSSSFDLAVCWIDDHPWSLNVSIPDLGPGCPIWEQLVDYARAVHKALSALD